MGHYRASATGSAVIGLEGAFDPPFLALGQTNVYMAAFCTYVTNVAEEVTDVTDAIQLSNAKVFGRHRYLDQKVGPWQQADMDVAGSTLTTTTGFTMPSMTGDWEFYFTADQKAPHYQIVDYTTGSTNSAAYGSGWTEEITNITCRATYPFALPSGGTDWFSRIREGQSAYKTINFVGQVTTNGHWGVDLHAVEGNERVSMELVGDHTWRYHYFVPTNRAGETLRFHFEGVGLVTNGTPFVYMEQTNTWYATATNVPYLPYTAVANGHVEAHVTLDTAATHLLIEFNEKAGSFSIAHATYQNFNMWTDALDGFRGDYVTTTGVSIAKMKFPADIRSWPETEYVRPTVWRETFNVKDEEAALRYPLGQYGASWSSPNGWSLQNGEFVIARRTAPHGRAFQMQGMGLGAFSLDKVGADAVPRGVGTVSFTARVAQSPAFDDFVYYFDGGAFANYAFSAKVSMSRLYDSKFNPIDVSPANPSLSLVGYYHPGKGCYEFRVVRSGDKALTAELWKWKPSGEPVCLATNVLNYTGNGLPGPGQPQINNFNNLLVPGASGKLNDWSNMCLSLYTSPDKSQTTICCWLAGTSGSAQNNNAVANDSYLKQVLKVTDRASPLTRGTFGVGSADCRSGFKYLQKHEATGEETFNKTGDLNFASIWDDSDWTYTYGESARWETISYTMGNISGYGIGALIPSNQTVKVCFAKQGEKDNAWIESGHEVVVKSFSTNLFTVSPCMPADYLVQLRTGGTTDDERTDVVIDYVDVTAWRGEDLPSMGSRGSPESWVYTMGSVETAVEVTGGTYDVVNVDGEGYAYVFTTNGNTTGRFTLKPRMDVVLDRVLAVGGDGRVQDVTQEWALTTNSSVTVHVAATEVAASSVQGAKPNFSQTSANGSAGGLVSDITGEDVLYGADGETQPRVIVRLKSNTKVCVLQPTRNYPPDDRDYPDKPMSVRSPYLADGLSLFSFSYREADTNAVLHLQICTNMYNESETYTPTFRGPADTEYWTTVATFAFSNMTAEARAEGTLTHFQSLRGPDHKGLMRLVVDGGVMARAQTQPAATRDLDYGKITITSVHCYDEPPIDVRSWWGWNLHTEGWDGGNKPGTWAYLTDSPDGLSCALNFSALADENKPSDPATYGIGLGEPGKAEGQPNEYAKNNPFIQSPVLANGIGTVSFRARTFETNAVRPAVVILYGTAFPDAYQPNAVEGAAWKRLAEFVVTNSTYTTYTWKAEDDGKNTLAVRLEVGGARLGRKATEAWQAWETPSNMPVSVYKPIERVVLDEVVASEPVIPRLKFCDVSAFRSGLSSDSREPVKNVTHMNEQPLIAESWGVQVRVEPQQMGDELDRDSIEVWMAYYICPDDVRMAPWGYKQWMNEPTCVKALLECVDRTNLVFRSTYGSAASVVPPTERPNTVVQYHVWATYRNKEGLKQPDHHLDATEWARPFWYWPIDYNATYGGNLEDQFSAYTILDSISPRRAWINEVNYNEYGTDENKAQFFELAVPQGADLSQWHVRLTSYTLYQYPIAEFGVSEGLQTVTKKIGTPLNGNYTNHYTLVSVRSPAAQQAGLLNAPESDGEWRRLTGTLASQMDVTDNQLRNTASYGLELVRPSGIVEHQVVLQGTNVYAGTIFELAGIGTNLVRQVKEKDGKDSTWFFAGEERKGNTLGVWTGHGEDGTWTNRLRATPGRINEFEDGTKQVFGDWFLEPNGTNVWVYAQVTDDHIWQYFNGNAASSNRSAVIILPKGSSTNIQYMVDAWHEPANCYLDDPSKPVTLAPIGGGKRRYQLALNDIQETVNVYAGTKPDARLSGEPYNLDPNDVYTPAVLKWLSQWDDDGGANLGIKPAAYCWPNVETKLQDLSLRTMYWLDIPPTEEGWCLLAGMGSSVSGNAAVGGKEVTVNGRPYTNAFVHVTMILTNTIDKVRRPLTLQSKDNISSRDGFASMTSRWDSVTFKVTGQLQVRDPQTGQLANKDYLPLRWFVFGKDSFDENGETLIEVRDPHLENTPGYHYGWHAYYGVPVFYGFKLDAAPSGVYTTEMLTSNAVYQTSSP